MAAYFYSGPPNWVFSAFAFVGFLCSAIPLPWHLEGWKTGTCLYMLWTALASLVFFVDSIVWSNNMIDWSPACTYFLNGFNLAIPACSLCISRRLYQIASVRSVTKTRAEGLRRKPPAIMIDLAIELGLSILQIPLRAHIHLFLVTTYTYSPSPQNKSCRATATTSSRTSAASARPSRRPSRLSLPPPAHPRRPRLNLETTRWATVARAFLLFGYFGFTDEAIKNYRGAFWSVVKRVGYSQATTSSSGVLSSNGRVPPIPLPSSACADNWRRRSSKSNAKAAGLASTLPVFIRKETSQKRDARSRASFDSDTSFSDVSASFAGLSYVDGEKSFGGDSAFDKDKSFGALTLNDVGGLLPTLPMHAVHAVPPEYSSPTSLSPPSSFPSSDASSSSSSSDAGSPSRPQTPVEADADAEEIEVSSLHRASVYHAPIPPAPAPAHVRDAADAV
ncbi:pheromone A receptor-domain-containing protein [Mycena latifolia]|nr:pheromone A receptor-domain-containing protein [Mycena latifolia]